MNSLYYPTEGVGAHKWEEGFKTSMTEDFCQVHLESIGEEGQERHHCLFSIPGRTLLSTEAALGTFIFEAWDSGFISCLLYSLSFDLLTLGD